MFHALVCGKDGRLVLACGAGWPLKDTEEPAAGLLDSEKCRRSGCRQVFERFARTLATDAIDAAIAAQQAEGEDRG